MKEISEMTRKEIAKLPRRVWSEILCEVNAIIIIPTRHKHDSGFMCMQYVACMKDRYILCGGGDVFHIDGIGGFGKWTVAGGVPCMIPPKGWSIDCLPKSGYLRLWSSTKKLTCESDLSSMCITTDNTTGKI